MMNVVRFNRPSFTVWAYCLLCLCVGCCLSSCSSSPTVPTAPTSISRTVIPAGTLTYSFLTSGLVNAVAWSPDGTRIASAGEQDDTVQVWEAITGRTLYVYRGHENGVLTAAWSPNGKYLASAGFGAIVKVWDAATGQTVLTYSGHVIPGSNEEVTTIAWSPDGKYLASAGSGWAVQVWTAPM